MKEMQARTEDRTIRLKRLSMRSMRRGTKEMDIVLSGFCASNLAEMDEEALDTYEALLLENDQDLYQWITGQVVSIQRYENLIWQINKYLSSKYS